MTACRWVASNQPRVLSGRHSDTCPEVLGPSGLECPGCQPCHQPHCRVCGRAHSDGTCAECMAETRETLHDLARMCGALPEEVEHRGVEGEAMMLLGPVADPEARQHVEAAYLSGRLPEGWIEAAHGKDCPRLWNEACAGCAGGELHPLTVLGTWHMVVTAELDHDEGDERLTVMAAVAYLDKQLTYLGSYEHVPFEELARDLRRCRAHLEAVLHDGEQRDTGAPCMRCNVPLERVWGRDSEHDGWRCPRCRETSTEDQYRFAVAHLHREEATHLTDRDMEVRTGVRAGTVREWARRGHVTKRLDSGRTLYAVADVMARVKAAS